jgi:hypothetical protein
MPRQDLIEAVKAHALANYETGGWDYIVECWGDAEIAEALTESHATTAAQAIDAVARTAGLLDERRREVQAEAF